MDTKCHNLLSRQFFYILKYFVYVLILVIKNLLQVMVFRLHLLITLLLFCVLYFTIFLWLLDNHHVLLLLHATGVKSILRSSHVTSNHYYWLCRLKNYHENIEHLNDKSKQGSFCRDKHLRKIYTGWFILVCMFYNVKQLNKVRYRGTLTIKNC